MTPADPPDSQPPAAQHTMVQEALPGILRAARDKSARRREQRPEQELIAPHRLRRQPARRSHRLRRRPGRALEVLRQPSHILHQLGKWPPRRARPGHQDQLDVRHDQRPHLAIRLANPAPRPIPLRRSTELPADREAGPPGLRAAPQCDEAWPLEPAAVLEDRLEFCRPPEALASRQREYRRGCWHCVGLDRQPLATLRAPTLEHLPPALRLHPRAKSVRLLPPPHIWLERPLHGQTLLMGGRTHVVYGAPSSKSRHASPLRPSAPLWYGRFPRRAPHVPGDAGARGCRAVQKLKRPFVAGRIDEDAATWPAVGAARMTRPLGTLPVIHTCG